MTGRRDYLLDGFARDLSRSFMMLIVPVSLSICAAVWSGIALPSFLGSESQLQYPVAVNAREDANKTETSSVQIAAESVFLALVAVLAITLMTFFVFLLYKCGCTIILYGWLLYSCASLLVVMTWLWMKSVLTYLGIPYTVITMALFVWNFSVVGVISVLYYAHPMVRQGYLVFASLMVTCSLMMLPEWTAWTLLIAVASYDLVAVLCPYGPLRLLVEESNRRSDPIPGFVYDADSAVDPSKRKSSLLSAMSAPGAPRLVSKLLRSRRHASSGKLGLGDFIFYGLLVGKAASNGFIEWTFCFAAILLGMVGTFTILTLYRNKIPALPALPLSIFLATFVYFTARYGVSSLSFYAASQGLLL